MNKPLIQDTSSTSLPSVYFVSLLSSTMAIGPLAMQIYLPALPIIQIDFNTSAALTQMTLSVSMLSIGVATIIYGPLSDRFGRRKIMIIGIIICILGSILCAIAPTIEFLIFGRVIQAAGGAVGMVLSRAIARDLYKTEDSAKVIATLIMVMVLAPTIAPVFGGFLTDWIHWRACFVFVAIIGVVILILVHSNLQETNRQFLPIASPKMMLKIYLELLSNPMYRGYTFFTSFSSVIFFTFISSAPFVMATILKRPPSEYGLFFIIVASGFMAGNFVTIRFAKTISLYKLITVGSLLALAGTSALLIIIATNLLNTWTLFLPVMFAVFGNGMSMPNAQAITINAFPEKAGSASGLTGFLQMVFASIAVQIVGVLQNETAWPMIIFMMIGSVCAAIALISLKLSHRFE